jgi:fumarate reductase flavoprotein subunit
VSANALPDLEGPERFDAIVVGAGLAGLVAAVRAQELGSRVLLVDRAEEPSSESNTVLSGGGVHLALLPMRTEDAVLRERIATSTAGGEISQPLVDAVIDGRHAALGWIADQGVQLAQDADTVYRLNLLPYRPLEGVASWRDRGPDRALSVLRARLGKLGGTILAGATARELIVARGGGVTAAVVRHGRHDRTIHARAVLLADGGFQADPALLRRHIGPTADRIKLRASSGGTGDGLRMSAALGAKLVNLAYFYGHLLHRDSLHDDRLWPYPQLDGLLPAGLLVGRNGRRFADEGLGGIATANVAARLEDPLATWLVTDDAGWAGFRPKAPTVRAASYDDPVAYFERAGARVVTAGSIRELAAAIDMDADALDQTMAAFDTALGAGTLAELPIPRTGRAARIVRPPFRAVPVTPAITFTMGGPLTDGSGRVLDADERPIPGLFAAGSTAGGLQGGPRGGYVGGLAPALIFGFLAGARMAAEVARS